ncbi:MAG: nuclear transport factor 2 family protein [Flavobacteriales bacterium]
MQRLPLLLLLIVPNLSFAQPDAKKEVLAVIDRFFATMAQRDSAGMAAVMMPDGVLYGVFEGNLAQAPRATTHANFLHQLKSGTDKILERYWDPQVRVDGPIATVTAPYDFHVNGKLSHCGIDVFDLLKDGDAWKISGGEFTMRREECPASPLGPVK